MIKLSILDCRHRKCDRLTLLETKPRQKWVCGITGRIPGNMRKCPMNNALGEIT